MGDDVMPGCMGTAALGTADPRSLAWCTCDADTALPTEDSMAARIAKLEQRITELEASQ